MENREKNTSVPETFEWILPELAVLNSKNG